MVEPAWSIAGVLEATGGRAVGEPVRRLCEVSTDTRTLAAGDLFVALRGERFDGHDYLAQAWQAGAGAALVEQEVDAPDGCTVVVVPDTLDAYGALARWWRRQFAALTVGLTGSCGKTSTKELTAAVLGQAGPTLATRANQNNEVGLPATLLQQRPEHRAVVLELAMRGAGQIDYLASIAEPDIGVLTQIGTSHVELLGSREAVADAKGELLDRLGPDGVAVLNADDPHQPRLAHRHRGRTLWYGFGAAADVRAEEIRLRGLAGSRFRLVTPGGSLEVGLKLPGRHMIANALAAASVGYAAGLAPELVAAGLEAAETMPLRLQVLSLANGARVINDAYNAAPDSVRAGLEVLRSERCERRVAVLGDMLELGELSQVEHLGLGPDVAACANLLIAVGERGAGIADGAEDAGLKAVHRVPDAAAAGRLLADLCRPGDLILLKASRALGLERALGQLEIQP